MENLVDRGQVATRSCRFQTGQMHRRILAISMLIFVWPDAAARADEQYFEFINRLQDRGYHDMVVEYVQRIRNRPNVPEDFKSLAELLIGKNLLAGAEQVTDLTQRDEQLQTARMHLEKFIREQPQHERVAEAQMDQAQILVARGRVALLQAENPNNAARKDELLQQSRSQFDAARKSFSDARDRFSTEFKKFPAFIPEEEKRKREAKAAARINVMQAHLNLGLVEYEFSQSFDRSSADYKRTLQQAIAIFKNVSDEFGSLLGGQYALMWQGKCYEEMGDVADLGKAEGIYNELMKHEDREPAMLALQRQVQFFQIIVLNKRGDHLLAADLARNWLQSNPTLRSNESGLGVQFEQAKGLIQQALSLPSKNTERNRFLSQATDSLGIVARYDTIYKQPAILLQQKYKGLIGSIGNLMTFDKVLAMGDESKDRSSWPEAADFYSQALRLAKDNLDAEQLAFIRYKLSFAHFQTKRYFEAAVLGEYVARHQPESIYAAPAAHVALEAFARAFNDAIKLEQPADFEESRIIRLVEYATQAWPKAPEANAARLLLAELHLHHGRFAAAGEAFESVTPNSPDYARSLGRSGDAFWQVYVEGASLTPEARQPEKMVESLRRARENLAKSVNEQRKIQKANSPPSVELAEAEINLADVSIESGQAANAVKLMQELVPKLGAWPELKSLELRALLALLRSAITAKELRAAEDAMKAIEATGKDLAQITRVYLDLGRQLQAEMERLRSLGDNAKYERTRDSYVAFLNQMAARREGQSFVTLQWTGEAFFGLEMYEQAAARFSEIANRSLSDPKFIDQSKRENREALLQVKLRWIASLRSQKRFNEAWDKIKPLPAEANSAKDPLHEGVVRNFDIIMERGLVLQDWGQRDANKLKTAIDHWAFWGREMDKLPQKPSQYFEVRRNLVRCLLDRAKSPADVKERQQRLQQAEQQLLFLTKTNTTLGGPVMKAEFRQLQRELEKTLGRRLGETASGTATGKRAGN